MLATISEDSMGTRTVPLFPLFLDLEGQRCVVVGSTAELREKCRRLLECGAEVSAIAPAFDDEWRALASQGALTLELRAFRRGDLRGARLAIADSQDDQLRRELVAEAQRERVLLNVVDAPECCDYYSAAQLRRGPLVLALGSSGAAPALVGALLRYLDARLPAGLGALAARLASERDALRQRFPEFTARARRLRNVLPIWLGELTSESAAFDLDERVRELLACAQPCDDPARCCQRRA